MKRLGRRGLRAVLTGMHRLLRLYWRVRRPRSFGAHSVALTPQGAIILVKLRYAGGWRLPGGGRKAREDPREAALRELREEIGMTSHGAVRLAAELEETVSFKQDLASIFIVRDVRYRPRWSFEVEQVREYRPDSLPQDLAPAARRWLQKVGPALS